MAKKLIPLAIGILVVLFVFAQRGTQEHPEKLPQRLLTTEELRIVGIARNAVIANEKTRSHTGATYDPKPNPKGGWIVGVYFYPLMPGSDRIVVIDSNDKVTDYIRGL